MLLQEEIGYKIMFIAKAFRRPITTK